MERLRVCLVVAYDLVEEGGVRKHAERIADVLRARGDHVELIGPYSGTAPLPEGTRGFSGVVNIYGNGSDNRLGLFSSPLAIRRHLSAGRFDVVHVMEPVVPALPWYAAWFAGTAARIATFHCFSEGGTLRAQLAQRSLCRAQLRLFDRAIAVSPAAARFARRAWPGPMTIIPNGVDTKRFYPADTAEALRHADEPTRILFVGRHTDARKGFKVLLESFALLRTRGVAATLDVVGHGGVPADAPAGVSFHGVLSEEELARRYRRCDVFVAPSLGMESFGMILLEAMASARPVVCSDITGYRATVSPEGARIVPPGDPAALARALAELAADAPLRTRMGEANRTAALAYDWTAVTARVRQVYVEALALRRGPSAEVLHLPTLLADAPKACARAAHRLRRVGHERLRPHRRG